MHATKEHSSVQILLYNWNIFPKTHVERALVIQPRTANSQIKALPLCLVPSSGPKGISNSFGSQQKHINDVKVEMGNQGEGRQGNLIHRPLKSSLLYYHLEYT